MAGDFWSGPVDALNVAGGNKWVDQGATPVIGSSVASPYLELITLPSTGIDPVAEIQKAAKAAKVSSFACYELSIIADSLAVLPLVADLNVGRLNLTLKLPAAEIADSGAALSTLAGLPGLLTLDVGAIPPKQVPAMPQLTAFGIDTGATAKTPVAAIGALVPNVTALKLGIHPDATWKPSDWKAFAKLTTLDINVSWDPNSILYQESLNSAPLKNASWETIQLALGLSAAVPTLQTIDHIAVTEWKITSVGKASSKAERDAVERGQEALRAEEANRDAINDLRSLQGFVTDWASKWKKAGPIKTVPVRFVVLNHEACAFYKDGCSGIPASKFCQTWEKCAAIVEVGVVKGKYYATYQTSSGVYVDGYYGNTTVTVYDHNRQVQYGPAVVATTKPPKSVTTNGTPKYILGDLDWGKAWKYIKAHMG